MASDADMVERDDLLGRLMREGVDGAGGFWDVRGEVGAGKTVLLREVARRKSRHDVVAWVDVQDYLTGLAVDEEQARPEAVAYWDNEFRRFSRMLSSLAEDLWGRSWDAVADAMEDTGRAADPAAVWDKVARLTEAFQSAASHRIRERAEDGGRVYVLVDNFGLIYSEAPGEVPPDGLGKWLRNLLAGLRDAVVAVARDVDPRERALAGATALDVGGLTAGQVRDYLVRRLGSQGAEIAPAVADFTGGHALAVGLIADLVSLEQRHGQSAADLIRQLVSLEQRHGQSAADLIHQLGTGRDDRLTLRDRLLERVLRTSEFTDPAVREGLYCLWAVRRFDFPLLERLLEASGLDEGHLLAERLVRYSFVERLSSADQPLEQYFVVHDHVREHGRELVSSVRLSMLAGVAQSYYQGKMAAHLDNYEGWSRYEDASWQAMVREWLYLVARLDGDEERKDARVGMAELFLNAFWWYGNYVPFRFCEELLADWAETADAGRDGVARAWGDWLRELYLRYPKGWRRQATAEEWRAVRQRLVMFLRSRPELREREQTKEREQAKKSVRRVRALMDIYLAEAERFLDPRNAQVEKLLQEARELFLQDEEQWDAAWVFFHQAEAALGREDPQSAMTISDEGWRECRALAEDGDDDPELAANLHRIHADAAWMLGHRGLALDLYARAALHAYKFQVSVGALVDEYTQAFLAEMHERAADRLAEMHAGGDWQVADEAGARIRQFFAPYWRDMDAAGMAGLDGLAELLDTGQAAEAVLRLFPPPPIGADLRRPDTAYALTAGVVLYEMEDELVQPPGTPLAPVDPDTDTDTDTDTDLTQEIDMEPSAAVVVADATGVIQSWNAEAQRLFGYPAEEVIGRTLDVIVPEPYQHQHWTGFRAVMNGEDVGLDHGAVRVPVRHRDGSVAHCAVRLIALLDPWDIPVGAVAVFVGHQPEGAGFSELPEL